MVPAATCRNRAILIALPSPPLSAVFTQYERAMQPLTPLFVSSACLPTGTIYAAFVGEEGMGWVRKDVARRRHGPSSWLRSQKYENGTLCATSWFNGATSPALPTFMRWMAGTPGFRLFDGMLFGEATGDLLSLSVGLVKV
ncbi:hypothetical protein BDP55DRAFT_218649 [Colletotrichum godetiae]|uniref:Uncharacterized protein n=1 Tax=Colletotrichum godetiae TaxID=1209918 RepID=A0AAJ0AGM6_9PEZI|nr:uncharacterized protein BDP55DRAFT_218649 [Colletotrichum godetiae]KAK1673541.1 hypothetical protein BDP55DRAFT_218649 [Colletotrichum godetiae]